MRYLSLKFSNVVIKLDKMRYFSKIECELIQNQHQNIKFYKNHHLTRNYDILQLSFINLLKADRQITKDRPQ